MKAITSARLACQSLGLPPEGRPWDADDSLTCALTGVTIGRGDFAAEFKPSSGFTDDLSIVRRTGVICGYVSAMMRGQVLIKTQRAVFTTNGAYSLAKDDDRAWLLLNPPPTPWCAVMGTSIGQHLVWRTPVTIDNNLMQLRVGVNSVLTIRKPILTKTLELIRAQREKDPKFKHGFARLDRDLKDTEHGVVRWDTPDHLKAAYSLLTPGEVWALGILAKTKAVSSTETPNKVTL